MKINSWKYKLQLYFTFTRRERNGILVLIAFILCLQLTLLIINFLPDPNPLVIDEATKQKILEIQKQWKAEEQIDYKTNSPKFNKVAITNSNDSLFEFDPNKTTISEWQKLGLSEKQSSAINKWIFKCGGIKDVEDFKKIKVLYPDQLERLLHYLRIDNQKNSNTNSKETSFNYTNKPKYSSTYSSKKRLSIEINSADSVLLLDLPMIGEGRARAIVKYRNSLGGYYSLEQLHEIRQLPDSIYTIILPYLKLDTTLVKRVDINSLEIGFYHPYFSKPIVKAIVNFRKQHGNYESIEQIMKIPLLDDKLYRKIAPYLLVN
jgi:competence protein ComEA